MKNAGIPTDHKKRSMLGYGTLEFPFACYLDNISSYANRHIEWHWHREFEISFVTEGTVRSFVDDACIILSSGDALFINSERLHHFESEDGVMYNMVFSPEFIANESSAVFQKSVAPYLSSDCRYFCFLKSTDKHTRLLEIIKDIGEISAAEGNNREIKLYSRVLDFWTCLVDMTKDTLTRKKRSDILRQMRLHKMMEYIQSNYSSSITLADIAQSANVSTSEALRCFKAGLKTTPVAYLNDLRMIIAFSKLVSSNRPVYQIALSAGFENTSYFCRKFKERYGVSPKHIREQADEIYQKTQKYPPKD